MAKGISGSFRANSLTQSDLQAMENHELRLDHSGARRSVRRDENGEVIPPLIYNPLRANRLTQAKDMHVEGAKVNKGASKVARHAFIQFPTKLEITPQSEQMMLDQAVAFVNKTHGGQAVFWARLDRDEEGRHGVDVFFAPKYEKATKRKTEVWVSLTKFGKERAIERFKQKPLEKRKPETGKFEPVKDAAGNPVMVDCDSKYYQGRVLQDLWFEHLRDAVGLGWVQRGERKIGRDPDRKEVEEYKVDQERKKLEAKRQEIQEYEATANRVADTLWDRAADAYDREKASLKAAEEAEAQAKKAEAAEADALRRAEAATQRAAEAEKRAEAATGQLKRIMAFLELLRPAVDAMRRYGQQEADYRRAEQFKDAFQMIDLERAKAWLIEGYISHAPLDEPANEYAAQEFMNRLQAGLKLPDSVSEARGVLLRDVLYDVRENPKGLSNPYESLSRVMVKQLVKHSSVWPAVMREVPPDSGNVRAKVNVDIEAMRQVYGLPAKSSDQSAPPDKLHRWRVAEPTLMYFTHKIGEALTKIATWLRVHEPVVTAKPAMPPEVRPLLDLPKQTQEAVEKALSQPPQSPSYEP